MKIEYNVEIWREADQFIAQALPLDVVSSGADAERARSALDEAVQLFLDTAAESGSLEQLLLECGYQKSSDGWLSPQWVATERHFASVA